MPTRMARMRSEALARARGLAADGAYHVKGFFIYDPEGSPELRGVYLSLEDIDGASEPLPDDTLGSFYDLERPPYWTEEQRYALRFTEEEARTWAGWTSTHPEASDRIGPSPVQWQTEVVAA